MNHEEAVPPNDIEAEDGVLASIFLDAQVLDQVRDTLQPRHFYRAGNGLIFQAMLSCAAAGLDPDTAAVKSRLKDIRAFDNVGGDERLAQLFDAVPSPANAAYFARRICEKAAIRAARTAALRFVSHVDANPREPFSEARRVADELAESAHSAFNGGSGLEVEAERRVFTFEPFLKQAKVERPDPIVDGLILQGSRVVLSGAPKRAQKTWTLLQLGLCVASGMDFLGFKVSKPGRVLFYSGEEPAWHVQERLAALSDYFGVTDPDTPLLLAGEDVPRIRLNIADMVDQLCATAQAWGATMIIMEPFRRLHDVNENDSTEIAPILDRLTDITRKTGAAVVLSHHTGKNKETSGGAAMRGSSDIHSWYDLGLAATTKDGSDDVHIEVESRHASASFFDMRLRKECEYLPGRFRRMWLERVLPSSNLDPVPDSRLTELRPKILKVLDKVGGGPLTKNTVCDRVEGRKADILNVIRIMLGAAELAEVGGGVSVVPGTSSQ